MRLRFLIYFLCILLFICPAHAEDAAFSHVPETLHPGKAERLSFSIPEDGVITLSLTDLSGNTLQVIRENMQASQGVVNLSYNGCDIQGNAWPQGEYLLALDYNGTRLTHPLSIGTIAPQITHVSVNGALTGQSCTMSISCNVSGTLTVSLLTGGNTSSLILSASVQAGDNTLIWDGLLEGA